MQLLRVKCTVKNNKLEAIFFVEKWTKVTQNVHKANTDKIYFLFNFSDLCSLHLDALHFTRFDGNILPSNDSCLLILRYVNCVYFPAGMDN